MAFTPKMASRFSFCCVKRYPLVCSLYQRRIDKVLLATHNLIQRLRESYHFGGVFWDYLFSPEGVFLQHQCKMRDPLLFFRELKNLPLWLNLDVWLFLVFIFWSVDHKLLVSYENFVQLQG